MAVPRLPTLREAIYGRLNARSFPMGPSEAADIATRAVEDFQAGRLEVCACGWPVVLCEHGQPWTPAVGLKTDA